MSDHMARAMVALRSEVESIDDQVAALGEKRARLMQALDALEEIERPSAARAVTPAQNVKPAKKAAAGKITRRHYDDAFKARVVARAGQIGTGPAAREAGLHTSVVRRWRADAAKTVPLKPGGNREPRPKVVDLPDPRPAQRPVREAAEDVVAEVAGNPQGPVGSAHRVPAGASSATTPNLVAVPPLTLGECSCGKTIDDADGWAKHNSTVVRPADHRLLRRMEAGA